MISEKIKEKLSRLPNAPGVYIMKNRQGKILYIGKAKSLYNRVNSYFNNSQKNIKTKFLVSKIGDFEFYVTQNEVESLILEANLIQNEKPPYNIRLKDDKRYPYLGLTNENYSTLKVVRKKNKHFVEYFGPYTSTYPMRQTLDFINKNFKLRKCNKKLEFGKRVGKPCLYFQMGLCLAPCQGNVPYDVYQREVDNVRNILLGHYEHVMKEIKEQMLEFSKMLEFEKAEEKRKLLNYIQISAQKQNINLENANYVDAFYFGEYDALLNVLVFFIRKEKITGRKIFFYENCFALNESEIISTTLNQFYSDVDYVPDTILVSKEFDNQESLLSLLKQKFQKNIKMMSFDKFKAKELLKLMKTNSHIMTEEYLLDKLRDTKKKGLYELKNILHLEKLPLHIEGFDISNTAGQLPVASMVCFKNGTPAKKEYRKFKIKTVKGMNDFAMMQEVVGRRYQRLLNENKELPNLILIDGGPQQLKFAKKSLDILGMSIPIISLAKREELIYLPDRDSPIKLLKSSKALQLLQFIRDESHRFAISFHKQLRSKKFLDKKIKKN